MLITRRNKGGYIYSYFEWDVVDGLGRQADFGRYMHVRDIWVHKDFDGERAIKSFIRQLDKDKRNEFVQWIYWVRKVNGQLRYSKLLSRKTCLRRSNSNVSFYKILKRNFHLV